MFSQCNGATELPFARPYGATELPFARPYLASWQLPVPLDETPTLHNDVVKPENIGLGAAWKVDSPTAVIALKQADIC